MTSRWARDYLTGDSICCICGAFRAGKAECCPVAPYVGFGEFVERYFVGCTMSRDQAPDEDHWVPTALAREFWDDYLHSDCAGLDDYIDQTTSCVM